MKTTAPWLLACLLLLALSCNAELIQGRVVAVADGDTVTVLDANRAQHKIRLAGIDAPEKTQSFGQRSKQSLSDLVFNRNVVVETEKRDRYGREVGKILVGELAVNLTQIRRGMAWFYRQYGKELSVVDRHLYDAAEGEALVAKRGLWTDAVPVPPWDYRKAKRVE
jgi:endonuclease YncB( thermonuclease family)